MNNLDLFVGAGTLVLAIGTFWAGWIARVMKGERAAADVAEVKADVAKVTADLAEFKVHVAANYAGNSTIEQVENRLIEAINRLGDRLDRVLERRPTRG